MILWTSLKFKHTPLQTANHEVFKVPIPVKYVLCCPALIKMILNFMPGSLQKSQFIYAAAVHTKSFKLFTLKATGNTCISSFTKPSITRSQVGVWSRNHKDQKVEPTSMHPSSRQLPTQVHNHLTVYVSSSLSYWKTSFGLSSSTWGIKHNSSMPQGIISLTVWLNVNFKYITYLLTYSMQQSPSSEANWFCS